MSFRAMVGLPAHIPHIKLLLLSFCLCCSASANISGQNSRSTLQRELDAAEAVLKATLSDESRSIPRDIRRQAACVIVVPALKKADFIPGSRRNEGVATCRNSRGWTPPSFISLSGSSFALLGDNPTDLILVAMKQSATDQLLREKFKLGADVSVAAGPIGRDAGTAWKQSADFLSFSQSRGVFAGTSLDGTVIRADEEANASFYESDINSEHILTGRVPEKPAARSFVETVTKYFSDGARSISPERPSGVAPTTVPQEPDYQVVRLFYATDRARGENNGTIQQFSGSRAESQDLTFGQAEVSIPRDHKMGELERPSLLRLEFREDPAKHIVLLKSTILDKNSFRAAIHARLSQDKGKDVLIFVHGYRVSFEDAAQRLGQITYDLGFPGAPILYSWPSAGELADYSVDEASAEWSNAHFLSFLDGLAHDPEIKNIYIIGHSMGNRIVAHALQQIGSNHEKAVPTIHSVVMAAPDIDAGTFQQAADAIRKGASRITIYESSNDKALALSHTYHGYSRLGDTSPAMHVFPQYECVEASSVETDFIGHSYFGDNRSILSDIYYSIVDGLPASQRHGLVQKQMNGIPYWSIKP